MNRGTEWAHWHKNMKTMKRKKSQTIVKDTQPKDWDKGSTEDGGKKLIKSHL
jgi:hypothetical protein